MINYISKKLNGLYKKNLIKEKPEEIIKPESASINTGWWNGKNSGEQIVLTGPQGKSGTSRMTGPQGPQGIYVSSRITGSQGVIRTSGTSGHIELSNDKKFLGLSRIDGRPLYCHTEYIAKNSDVERLTINNGNIGIGVKCPSSKLIVQSYENLDISVKDAIALHYSNFIGHMNHSKMGESKEKLTNRIYSDIDPYGEENWDE